MKLESKKDIRIVFRADGNSIIGLGHIMRSLALVEMLKYNFECLFVVNKAQESLISTISIYCKVINIQAIDINDELTILKELLVKKDILVLDGYSFNEYYQQLIKSFVAKLVMIDDMADKFYHADAIINHGGSLISNNYKTIEGCKIYTGFPYVIVREQFLKAAKNIRIISKVDSAFICMGGADPYNITIKIVEACSKVSFIKKVIVVVGSAYNHRTSLKDMVSKITSIKMIDIIENADEKQMVELMAQCEIAISTASTISLEICCIKAGLITGTIVDNQKAIHSQLIDNSCCISINDWNTISVEEIVKAISHFKDVQKLQNIINTQANNFDGKSNERIVEIFKQLAA